MDHTLIENWNSVVPEDGIVIHCGDFMLPHDQGFKEYEKYVKKLNGMIYLTSGNHDRIPNGEYCLKGDDKVKMVVNEQMMIHVDGVKIIACHFPLLAYPADYHVFGHIHTLYDGTCYGIDGDVTKKLRPTQYDVGVDQNNYTPVSYWQLVDIFRNRAKNIGQ